MKRRSKAAQKDGITVIVLFVLGVLVFTFSTYTSIFLRSFIVSFLLFSIIVACLGIDREIGFVKAFFLSFFLSPLIGLIVTVSSAKLVDEEYKEKMLIAVERNAESSSVADQLFKLNELRKDGVLTEEEFEAQKERLLNS